MLVSLPFDRAASVILVQDLPDVPGDQIIVELLRHPAEAWPNIRIVEIDAALV